MKIIKTTMEWHWSHGLLQDRNAVWKEEEVEDIKPFSAYEIELFKKWLEMYQEAWDSDDDDCLDFIEQREFGEDYKKYIRRFSVLADEFMYEPEDFILLDNNTIKTPMGVLVNLDFAFLETTEYYQTDARLTAYVVKK